MTNVLCNWKSYLAHNKHLFKKGITTERDIIEYWIAYGQYEDSIYKLNTGINNNNNASNNAKNITSTLRNISRVTVQNSKNNVVNQNEIIPKIKNTDPDNINIKNTTSIHRNIEPSMIQNSKNNTVNENVIISKIENTDSETMASSTVETSKNNADNENVIIPKIENTDSENIDTNKITHVESNVMDDFQHIYSGEKILKNNIKLPAEIREKLEKNLKRIFSLDKKNKDDNKYEKENTTDIEISDFKKYPFLFHKYILNIRNMDSPIKYDVVLDNFLGKRNICHIHCYDLNNFDRMFSEYIEILNTYFSMIITFCVMCTDTIDKYPNFVYINAENYGYDIGPKFYVVKYLETKSHDYDYIFFIHSKSCDNSRKNYISEFINNMISINRLLEKNKNLGGIFPPILHIGTWYISDKNTFGNKICWSYNKLYMNDYIRYLGIKNNKEYLFPEGNFYILNKKIIQTLYGDKKIYNILNTEDSFDYQWVKIYYKLDGNIQQIYNICINKDLFKNNMQTKGQAPLPDAMIEHTFERLVIILCKHLGYEFIVLGYPSNINKYFNKKIETESDYLEFFETLYNYYPQ